MIAVSKQQRDELEKAGILQHARKLKNGGTQDANFVVVNRTHKSRAKNSYVTETVEVLSFLGMFDNLNLQLIRQDQLQSLIDAHLVDDRKIQKFGEYNPSATVFIDKYGKIRCKKITEYMKRLGIWK